MGLKFFGVSRFDGGTNSRSELFSLDDSQSPDNQNCYPDILGGAIGTRLGVKPLGAVGASIAVSAITITDIYNFRQDGGSENLMAFGAGNAYLWQTSPTSAWTIISDSLGAFVTSARVDCMSYRNYVYMRDGYSQYKWNGSLTTGNFTRMGVSFPSGTLTGTSGGTGPLSGTYLFGYTYVNSLNVESNMNSAMTGALSLVCGSASLTGFQAPAVSFGVQGIRIYATVASGSAYLYGASFPVTTAVNYSIPSGSLGAGVPTNHFPPPASAMVHVAQKDSAFFSVFKSISSGSNPNYVWFSNIGEPETVGAANFVRFGWDSDNICVLATASDQIVVGKTHSMWELHMQDPGDSTSWYPRKIPTDYGGETPFFAVPFADQLLTMSRFGVLAINFIIPQSPTIALPSVTGHGELASRDIYVYSTASQVPTVPLTQYSYSGPPVGWTGFALTNSTIALDNSRGLHKGDRLQLADIHFNLNVTNVSPPYDTIVKACTVSGAIVTITSNVAGGDNETVTIGPGLGVTSDTGSFSPYATTTQTPVTGTATYLPATSVMKLNTNKFMTASGIAYGNAVWVAYTSDVGSYNDSLWYFPYVRAPGAREKYCWYRMAGLPLSSFAVYSDNLYAASAQGDGYVYQLEVPGQYKDRVAVSGVLKNQSIDSYWSSKAFTGQRNEMNEWKDFRDIRLIVSGMSGQSMRIDYHADQLFQTSGNVSFFSIDPAGAAFGFADGANNIYPHVICPAGVSGRSLRFRVSNYNANGTSGVTDSAWRLINAEIDYSPRGRR